MRSRISPASAAGLVAGLVAMLATAGGPAVARQPAPRGPNILVVWGDDIGTWNVSHNSRGMMGYRTPNIDRLAREGVSFTDYYGQQSCTAGRAAFLGGNCPVRTGMTKVGLPGAKEGWQKTDVTIATVLRSRGYATGQFGKNHQGDRDEHLPTMHGFDEFFGNLYHLNAEEEPEHRDYPGAMKLPNGKTFRETYGPRGVLRCKADGKGGQTIENTGPLTRKQNARPRLRDGAAAADRREVSADDEGVSAEPDAGLLQPRQDPPAARGGGHRSVSGAAADAGRDARGRPPPRSPDVRLRLPGSGSLEAGCASPSMASLAAYAVARGDERPLRRIGCAVSFMRFG